MLSFFPRGVLDWILNLIESVSEGFPSSSFMNSFVSQFTVVFGTVSSVSVVTFSADYCTFNML